MAAPSPPHSPTTAATAAPAPSTVTAAHGSEPNASQAQQQQSSLNGDTGPADGIAPKDIPASAAFADALMNFLLADAPLPAAPLATTSTETSPPRLDASDLPLALDSPLRRHESQLVPGIRLTHPGGWLEGSRPSTKQVADHTDAFLDRAAAAGRTGPRQMQRDVEAEAGRALAALRERLRQRQAATRQNEQLDKQMRDLEAERAAERTVEEMTRRKRAGGA